MKVSKSKFLIPYDAQGRMYDHMPTRNEGDKFVDRYCHQTHQSYQEPVYWQPNMPWKAELTVQPVETHQGLRSKYIKWKNDADHTFYMFANNLPDLLLLTTVTNGRTPEIEWVVRKHGREFGIVAFEGYNK